MLLNFETFRQNFVFHDRPQVNENFNRMDHKDGSKTIVSFLF